MNVFLIIYVSSNLYTKRVLVIKKFMNIFLSTAIFFYRTIITYRYRSFKFSFGPAFGKCLGVNLENCIEVDAATEPMKAGMFESK